MSISSWNRAHLEELFHQHRSTGKRKGLSEYCRNVTGKKTGDVFLQLYRIAALRKK